MNNCRCPHPLPSGAIPYLYLRPLEGEDVGGGE